MANDWIVRKAPQALRPGDRFIFTEDMGGEGEVLTVTGVSANMFGTTEIGTEELDFDLDVNTNQMLTMAPPEGEES